MSNRLQLPSRISKAWILGRCNGRDNRSTEWWPRTRGTVRYGRYCGPRRHDSLTVSHPLTCRHLATRVSIAGERGAWKLNLIGLYDALPAAVAPVGEYTFHGSSGQVSQWACPAAMNRVSTI